MAKKADKKEVKKATKKVVKKAKKATKKVVKKVLDSTELDITSGWAYWNRACKNNKFTCCGNTCKK